MGVREIERSLRHWQIEVKDLRRRMILAPTPREREAVVRHVTAGPRVDGIGHGRGAGKGPSHHRTPSTSSGGRQPLEKAGPQP